MKINVYLSPSLRESESAFHSLTESLRTLHLEPISVGEKEFATDKLLKGVEARMRRSLGAIVVGSPIGPASWNQLEAGIALALGLPLLVILDEGGGLSPVARTVNKVLGLFGFDVRTNIFGQGNLVHQAHLKDPSWAHSDQVRRLLEQLKKNMEKRFVGGERGNGAEPTDHAWINRAVTINEPVEAALVPEALKIVGTAPSDADVWVVTHIPGAPNYYVLGPTKSVGGEWRLTVDANGGVPKFKGVDSWVELPGLELNRGVVELRALINPTEPLAPGSRYGWPEVRNGDGSNSTTRFVIKA